MRIKVEVEIHPQGGGIGWPEVKRFVPCVESVVTGFPKGVTLTEEQRDSIVDPIVRLMQQLSDAQT